MAGVIEVCQDQATQTTAKNAEYVLVVQCMRHAGHDGKHAANWMNGYMTWTSTQEDTDG